jgi:hypothetical protein
MESSLAVQAVELMQRSNGEPSPEAMTSHDARELLATYTKVQRLAAFGIAALTRKINDAEDVAGITGTSVGQAKSTIETGREQVPSSSPARVHSSATRARCHL